MDCRGYTKRSYIARTYDVVPVAHLQLLKGQIKKSDAGATIENDYYIFEATDKTTGDKEIIRVGKVAAKDFLSLIKHPGLPIFNVLHGWRDGEEMQGEDQGNSRGGSSEGGRPKGEQWNPVQRQLYNAVMWLIIAWDATPKTPIYEIEKYSWEHRSEEPLGYMVKSVNTMLKNGGKGKTLTQIIDVFRKENDIRDNMCQFDLLTDIINNYEDKDGNKITSWF